MTRYVKTGALIAALLIAQASALFGQNTGFVVGAGGAYTADAVPSVDIADRNTNPMRGGGTASLFLGGYHSVFEFGLETSYVPKKYGVLNDNGSYAEANYTQVPLLLQFYYVTPGLFSVKPHVFAGVAFDLVQGLPESNDVFGRTKKGDSFSYKMGIQSGLGLDLAYNFPGEYITMFARAQYSFLIPLKNQTWYMFPTFGGGIRVYPFGRKADYKNPNLFNVPPRIVSNLAPPIDRKSIPSGTGHELLETMRNEIRNNAQNDVKNGDQNEGQNGVQNEGHNEVQNGVQNGIQEKPVENAAVPNTAKPGTVVLNTAKPAVITTVYFPPDESVPFSPAVLDAAGAKMKADPSLAIKIKGYSAAEGTVEGQYAVSEARARYCTEYLHNVYDIGYNRITFEWFGADKMPADLDGNSNIELFRAAELIIGRASVTR